MEEIKRVLLFVLLRDMHFSFLALGSGTARIRGGRKEEPQKEKRSKSCGASHFLVWQCGGIRWAAGCMTGYCFLVVCRSTEQLSEPDKKDIVVENMNGYLPCILLDSNSGATCTNFRVE